MMAKLSTGKIVLGDDLQSKIITNEVVGSIDKVVIKYGEDTSPEINIIIMTSDGEAILNVSGSKDGIYYPRNWNVQNQKYIGVNIVEPGAGALNAEKYNSYGPLFIYVVGASKEDYIKDIRILIEGEIIKAKPELESIKSMLTKAFNKLKDAPVTSTTTGVMNPRHRRRAIVEFAQKTLNDVMKETKKKVTPKKRKASADKLADMLERNIFRGKFEGVSAKKSNQIKEFILRSLKKGVPMERIINYINRVGGKGMTLASAETIARTETQAVQNTMREWSFKQVDPKEKFRYKWMNPLDDRTTDICRKLVSRSQKGVTLEALRKMIKEEAQLAGFNAREWTPHIGCRSTFIRAK